MTDDIRMEGEPRELGRSEAELRKEATPGAGDLGEVETAEAAVLGDVDDAEDGEPVAEMGDPAVVNDPWASYRSEDVRESARSGDARDPGEQQRRLATMLERARFRVRLRGSGAHEIRKIAERLRAGEGQLDDETAYQLEQVVESFMTAVQDAEATIKGMKRYIK